MYGLADEIPRRDEIRFGKNEKGFCHFFPIVCCRVKLQKNRIPGEIQDVTFFLVFHVVLFIISFSLQWQTYKKHKNSIKTQHLSAQRLAQYNHLRQMQFDFPSLPSQRFGRCLSVPHLRELLRSEMIEIGLDRKCKYRVAYYTQKLIYAKCLMCTASLKYKLEHDQDGDRGYLLIRHRTKHIHNRPRSTLTKKQQVIQFLHKLPPGVQPNSMRKYVMKTFETSYFTFYQALKDLEGNQRGVSFKTMLPFIQENGYAVFEPFPVEKVIFFPDFCLFVSPGMKKRYLEFGRFIAIDFTYNLIRERPYINEEMAEGMGRKTKPKHWITGIISGLDSARRLLVYGIAFCYSETADSIEKIFDNFFDLMGRPCETIISDGGLGIEEAIKRLKARNVFTGAHLLDAYHVMANLKVKFNHSETLRELYLAADEEEYYHIFESEVVHMQASQQQKFAKFETLSKRFCLSKIPLTFVGLGSSTCMSQKINDLIKTVIPHQTSISEVFSKLIRLANRINQCQPDIVFETYPFEQVFLLPQLKDLRGTLNKHVFRRLLRQIFKASSMDYQESREKCQQRDESRKWDCECGFRNKTGLPCRHIVKVLLAQRQPIISQIDQYWLLTGREQREKRVQAMRNLGHRGIRRGRPRKSRRNMKK